MRSMSKAMELLREMLSCGNMELESLEDVGYDWHDVLDQLDWPDCDGISYGRLMRAVVDVGIIKIKEAIDDRICELEAIPNERHLSASEEEELTALQILNPDEDIRCAFNGIDGHIWCEECGNFYRAYLWDAIEDFEKNVGYSLTLG